MKYGIVFSRSIKKDLRRIPQLVIARIQEALRALQENPFPPASKKLNDMDNLYRIRVGNYRIMYLVDTKIRIITVVRIGDRKDVYKML